MKNLVKDTIAGGVISLVILIMCILYLSIRMPATVTLFYSKTCPHCIAIKGDWEAFENWADRLKRARTLIVRKIDINDPENASLVKSYNVKGVPTIIKEKWLRRTLTFEGERSLERLVEFSQGW